ncbi:PAS domain S-box protein [Methanomicrobium antiquum]|uniref:PAS domain S-box protein n=1 Tax=Methanomicrobium antiquum TaxID=487686 RepID=A0AAF0FPW1_9EURY|nr:PAS domain S-box protein [Methanomicrobium antiquum]WFN36317.1 PAS domain S-box protein [Methanomicrobium antiquum]
MDIYLPEKYQTIPVKLFVLVILTVFTLIITFFSLSVNVQVVFTHFYYIPIILAAYWFTKKAIVYTIFLCAFYLVLVYILSFHNLQICLEALLRCLIFTGISSVTAILSMTIKNQRKKIKESEMLYRAVWENVQAGIVLINPEDNKIISINPEALKITGFSESEVLGHVCHKLICPTLAGNCPIRNKSLKIENAERIALSKDGKEIPILKTATAMQIGDNEFLIECFIDISKIKEAEATLLGYIREATLRIRNPVSLVKNNLTELKKDLNDKTINPEYFITTLSVQEKHMEEILKNLKEIEQAVAEKHTEIPEELRNYLKRE